MANLVRTGVSLEQELLRQFDESIRERGYQNRSEAIRDLIRDHLVSREANKTRSSPERWTSSRPPPSEPH